MTTHDSQSSDVSSALPARQLVDQWRPIETAPRPSRGRRQVIDVWCVTDDHESAKFYFGNTMSGVKDRMMWQGRVSEVYWLDGAWRPATGLRMHGLTVTPTHWMPLPAPPALAALLDPAPPETNAEELESRIPGPSSSEPMSARSPLKGDQE